MANDEHLAILKQGVEVWNAWREANLFVQPDLKEADLSGANLERANLWEADLTRANLSRANLSYADLTDAILNRAILHSTSISMAYLSEADLTGANLVNASLYMANLAGAILTDANLSMANLIMADLKRANLKGADLHSANLSEAFLRETNLSEARLWKVDLSEADLSEANLSKAYLGWANLSEADLSRANLSGASLELATLVDTNLAGANLNDCKVYGVSAWDVSLEGTQQENLVITKSGEASVTVDNLEVAQFIYLMMNNQKVRSVLETLTTKSVLILGRFSGPMKDTLDAMRDKLREKNYLPIMFDFERLSGKDYTETIKVLAGMSKFVIADLSGARSIQQELQAIIPDFELPVVPIIQADETPWSMFESHQRTDHVLSIVQYRDSDDLMTNFEKIVVLRAEKKYDAILVKKAKQQIETLSVDEVLDE